MNALLEKIHRAQVEAAEKAAIAAIPAELVTKLHKAQVAFEGKGGCPGCGSMILAVHTFPCSEIANDLY